MDTKYFTTFSEEETISLGLEFASKLKEGDVVALNGELGSGKTEFVKGICNFFQVHDIVNSPTFTIVNQYTGTKDRSEISILHIDLYRIKSLKELDEIGFNEYIYSESSIKLLEWADKAKNRLPSENYTIQINTSKTKENERNFTISHN